MADDRPNPWLEKRKFVRFRPPAAAEVSFSRLLIPRTVAVRVLDLCEGGAGLLCPEELSKGSTCSLRIEYKELNDRIEIRGCTVVRSAAPPPVAKDWSIGLTFDELPREQQVKIAGWRNHLNATMVRKREDDKHEEKRKELGLHEDGPVKPGDGRVQQ